MPEQDATNPTPPDSAGAPGLPGTPGTPGARKENRAQEDAAAQALAAAKAALGSINDTINSVAPPAEQPQMAASPVAAPAASAPAASGAAPFVMPSFNDGPVTKAPMPDELELLGDVNLNVKVELGRTRMLVDDVLRLCEGAVVELDKLAGDPVDIFVNDQHVARGEVLVLNDNFCVRISEIVNPTT